MPRSLRVIVLTSAAAGCWSTAAPSRTEPSAAAPTSAPEATPLAPSPITQACGESGERLVLSICRRDDDLAWMVTNNTNTTLWVFVAPPSLQIGNRTRANAFVEASGGRVMLHKIQLTAKMDEPIMSGAIMLAPGGSDAGVVPLGKELVPQAPNLWPRSANRVAPTRQVITTVTLEVGFAERRSTDRPIPPDTKQEFYLFMNLDKARHEAVLSPELSWR